MPSWLQKVPSWLWINALCLSQSALRNFAPYGISDINRWRLSHWYRVLRLFLRGKELKIAYRLDPSFWCPRWSMHFSFPFYFKLVYFYVPLRTIPWFQKMSLTQPHPKIQFHLGTSLQPASKRVFVWKFVFGSFFFFFLLFLLFVCLLVCFLWDRTSFIAFPHLASL